MLSQAPPAPAPGPAPGPMAAGGACVPSAGEVGMAQDAMNGVSGSDAPQEINSRHAVMIVPGEPLEVGTRLAAEAYAAMPRTIKDGEYKTTFTKFVVVGHGENTGGPLNIVVGDDVCGHPGFADADAVQFLRSTVKTALGAMGPPMANCKADPEKCPEPSGPTFDEQIPFLDVLTNSSLKGNLLPIMLEGQSIELGAHVGDALGLLAGSGGVWAAERVLFVFGADFSVGLDASKAMSCDSRTAQVVATGGVPNAALHFKHLWEGDVEEGDCGHKAIPRGFSTIIAAAKTAETLKLSDSRHKVSRQDLPPYLGRAPDDAEMPVLGYAHILFWADPRPASEKMPRANIMRPRTKSRAVR